MAIHKTGYGDSGGATDPFPPGTICRVREWDDMAEEYGLKPNGDIRLPIEGDSFIASMKRFCGMQVEILESKRSPVPGLFYYTTDNEDFNINDPTNEMLILICRDDDGEDIEATEIDLSSLLS